MKKNASSLVKIGMTLLLTGIALFLAGSAALGFDYTKLDTRDYGERTVEPQGVFTSVRIWETTADVSIRRAEDGVCRVELLEDRDHPHSVEIRDGVLVVEQPEKEPWGFFRFRKTHVDLCLPEERYEALRVETGTGDVSLAGGIAWDSLTVSVSTGDLTVRDTAAGAAAFNLSTGSALLENADVQSLTLRLSTGDTQLSDVKVKDGLLLSCSTGDVSLNRVRPGSVRIKTTTGDVFLQDTAAAGEMEITSKTGRIRLEGADAASLHLTTVTGDITGSLLSSKRYETHTHTGGVQVPYGKEDAGLCRLETDTGSIMITEP